MGKNYLNDPLIEFHYEDEIGVFVPYVSFRQLYKERKRWNMKGRGHGNYQYHAVGDIYPWTRTRRIYVDFEGLPFDDAFSKYCLEVPVYQQFIFLENIDRKKKMNIGRYGNNTHYVDDNGLIQSYPNVYNGRFYYKANEYVVTSIDYKTEFRHKITGAKKPHRSYWSDDHLPIKWITMYPGKTKKEAKEIYESEFEEVVVSGWKKVFDSDCREYRRLSCDKMKKIRKRDRIEEKIKSEKTYSFLTKSEMNARKFDSDNDLKIVRKGFDLETSFRD